jgi:WD40 repeat protein/serine/threonine protein kinase
LPQRTIADIKKTVAEGLSGEASAGESDRGDKPPGSQENTPGSPEKAPSSHAPQAPGEATVQFSLSDTTPEAIDIETLATLELSGQTVDEIEVPKLPTVTFEADRTIDFGATPPAPGSAGDVDFTLLTSQWDAGDEAASDPNATIKQKETITGSFVTSSSLIVKSRSVRTSGQVESPTTSPADSPDYELLNVIGEGGMGVVYAARQSSIARTVALKMLKGKDGQNAAQREKFVSEAVVTGELDHPNIVPIYDLGANDDGALFYSMKRVRGTPWNKVLKQKSLDENLDVLLRVADAVAFAHVNGVIHRDLKPENTMLGDFGEVLVMDWGLARVTSDFPSISAVSQSDAMGGTPAYMAPEMATGPVEKITAASDVYLLGAILYELLAGRPPHSGETVMACLYNAAKNKISAVDRSVAERHGELLSIAMRAMTTEPEQRYPSVQDFQRAVRQYQAHSESITLAGHAQRHLQEASEKRDYDLYARAVFGLEESLGLWPENRRAAELLSGARVEYAQLALANGDYDLGASLLDEKNEAHRPLLSELQAGRTERESRQRRIKLLKGAVAALLAAVGVVVGVAFLAVSRERDVAVRERDRAETEKARAVKAEGEARASEAAATSARDEAQQQRDRAVSAEKVALDNEAAAVAARKDAEVQRDRAEAEEAEAQRQRQFAVAARDAEEYAAYVARIGLAKTKIDENAFDRAAELLAQCKESLRHWEWGRLEKLCALSARSWTVGSPIDSAAFSPDGRRFAVGDWSGHVSVRDVDGSESVWQAGQGQYVHSVAYSPDGSRIAAGASDGSICLYRAADGVVEKRWQGHAGAVLSVRFSPDGRQLASCGYDNAANIWDAQTGQLRQTLAGHAWWVWSAEYSPSGDELVTASQDGKVIVWRRDANGQFSEETQFTGHKGPVYAACFSPRGRVVASAGYDGRVLLWNPDEVRPVDVARRLDGLSDAPPNYQTLAGHRGPVRTLSFSADGSHLASGGQDNMIVVWDAVTGRPWRQLRGHASHVRSADFSPDGERLLSAGRDGQAKLWLPAQYAEVQSLPNGDEQGAADAVLAARFSPDGGRIVTASRDRTAALWDAATRQRVQTFAEGHEFLATSAEFFPDGVRLATGAGDGTVRLWNVAAGSEMQRLDGTGRTGAVTVSGAAVATGGPEGVVQLWNADDGRRVAELKGHEAEVTALRFAPGGEVLASGDDRGAIRLWRRDADGRWNALCELTGHSRTITALAFADDGRRLISSSGDNTCGQWDVAAGEELADRVLKHPEWVSDLVVDASGRRAVTACDDGKLRVWDLEAARVMQTFDGGDKTAFTSIDLSRDGKLAAAACAADGTVRLWNVDSGEELTQDGADGSPRPWLDLGGRGGLVWSARFAPEGRRLLVVGGNDARLIEIDSRELVVRFSPHGAVASADVSPDGTRVVTGSWDRSAKIWDAATGKVLVKLDALHEGYVNSACFSPDGARVLTASDDGTARLWNAADGRPLEPVLRGHEGRIRQAVFSPDGDRILTVGSDKKGVVHDAATGAELFRLSGHQWGLLCGAYSGDGRLIVTGGEDNAAIVWNAQRGEPIVKLSGHTAAVTCVALSRDGRRALTGSQDNSVKLWDAATGKEILTLAGHSDEVTSVGFSPDGLTVLTSGRDGQVLAWPAANWATPAPHQAGQEPRTSTNLKLSADGSDT